MLGDESTTGREEQQYSCDVGICGRNQEHEFDALETKEIAVHVNNSDKVDLLLSKVMVSCLVVTFLMVTFMVVAACVTIVVDIGYR